MFDHVATIKYLEMVMVRRIKDILYLLSFIL